ncbi:DUF6603 domain-containing protein [Kineosporia babensis]|uniref:DUF6603 domain-containing protein n=1 Tax=Kineosporia babensis TaxID=499548 RepID=A0A9X1NJG6_9ACTN|nr:DUF6603 domain-containing protein [Kineosporia babensis]MCD5315200.1 hypothetical protein [Kineosporia babensis]
MTPDQLRGIVTATDGRLDVQLDALTGISAFFTGFFPAGRLVLTSVTTTAATADGVTVTGTGASGPFTGMAVSATFAAAGGTVTALVRATGDQNWTFVDAFGVLRHSIFDSLRFQGPALVLDSTTAVMSFTGTLIITTPMAPLDLLLPGVTHTVTGEITTVTGDPELGFPTSTVPDILLYGPQGASLDLGLFTLTDLRYEILGDPTFDYDVVDYAVQSSIVVTGSVPVRVAGVPHSALLYTEIFGWGDSVLFVADFTDLGPLSLADVAAFTGQSSLPIPFDFDVSSPVVLTDVRMLVAPKTMTLSYISVKLETAEEWQIVEDVLDLQAIDLTFRIDSPLSGARLSGVLSGLFGIGASGVLEMSANFGDRSVGGALRSGDGPLSIREVYTDFTGQDPAPVPDLAVARFDFGLAFPPAPQPFTYHGFLELVGDWKLTDQLSLTDVMFSLSHDPDTRFAAMATFVIQGVGVAIGASYDPAPDKQWEFSGASGPGQQIAIGELFQTLAGNFGAIALPTPISQLVIENLGIEVSTGTKRLYLTGEALFPIDTASADLTIAIDTAQRSFTASLVVSVPTAHGPFTPRFDLLFAQQETATLFTAAYSHATGDPVPALKDLIAALLPSAAAYVPDGLVVDLNDTFMAVDGPAKVFGADLAITLDLSHLPVFGDHLDLGVMGFDPLRLVALSAALSATEVTAINGQLPTAITKLPDGDRAAGFLVSGKLKLGVLEQPMALPVSPAQTAPPITSKQTQTADNTLWYKVQRSFGPIQLDRVGVAYLHEPGQPARLSVRVDASVSAGGLTLSCDGLSASVSLADPAALPVFDLAGLGVSYTGGPVTLSGAFLRNTVTYQGKPIPSYSGKAVIETETFTLGALGSYLQLPEGPSLFVYAFLNYPIGGPAFFFVEGIAAGFGYNRRFIAPAVDQIASFPLVAEAVGTTVPGTLATELSQLADALPPSPGDVFLAAGLRFTSFKMIDSFLLVTAGFGHRFELNVLGLSTLVLPVPDAGLGDVTPVAEIQLAMKASFMPDDGYFSLLAQLTSNSYLLSRACRLTGGFAFVTWFAGDHDGDFVLTVGGYHPHFTKPGHYPAVPRLGFDWKVSDKLALKGSAYFALTPGALMAGAALSATYEDGSLRAWFDAGMDFLIAWQPYHYEAALHISVGASYTFSFFGSHTINVHVGTDVRFWGPDFGGTAYIDLDVISFTITFGSSGGASAEPVPWNRFRTAQLPAADKAVTVVLRGGAPQAAAGTYLGTVNPAELELLTDSCVPATSGRSGTTALTGTGALAFAIAPVGAKPGTFTSVQTINITQGTTPVNASFRFEPVAKSLPAALWGEELTPTLSKEALCEDMLTGYVVRPTPPVRPATTSSLPVSSLQSATALFVEHHAFEWVPLPTFTKAADQTLNLTAGAQTRDAIAGKLRPDLLIDLNGLAPADFLLAPEVGANG